MIDRRSLLGGLALTWLAAGCGGSEGVAPEAAPRDGDGQVRLLLRVDVGAARAAGEVPPGAANADVVRQVISILEQRLSLLGRRARIEPTSEGPELLAVTLLEKVGPDELARLIDQIEARGRLRVHVQAGPNDILGESGTDLASETEKLDTWSAANPDRPLAAFNELPAVEGGPVRATGQYVGLIWGVAETDDSNGPDLHNERQRAVPMLVQPDEAWRFETKDLKQVYLSQDRSGYPAVGFELAARRKADFGAFTEAHVDRNMVIELDGTCVAIATILERLPGVGIIMGRESAAEVEARIALLRAGELPAPVQVVAVR